MSLTLGIYGIKDVSIGKYPNNTHDHNICLMENGKIVKYLHLERYTRKKYDNRLDEFIEEILENEIDWNEKIDFIFVNSFEGNSFISRNGKIKFESSTLFPYPPKMVKNCFCKISNLGTSKSFEPDSYLLSHELAHIFTSLPFFGEFHDDSLLIHLDGGASVGNFSAFFFKNKNLHFIESHWELSHLTKLFYDNALMFAILGEKKEKHNSLPGKIMALASYGNANDDIEKWLIKNNFFKDIWKKPSIFFKSVKENFSIKLDSFDNKNPFLHDVVATVQRFFEKNVIKKIKELKKEYNAEYLYFSGGAALNIKLNAKLIKLQLFKDVFIPPAPNDSGLSIGAAAFLEWKKGQKIKLHGPYLNNIGLKSNKESLKDHLLIEKVANLLLRNKIVGVCIGYGEAGPRALGNRSILALPNSKDLSRKVSMECKGREWYRPLAPIMLKSVAEVVTEEKIHHLSKYMLISYHISQKYRKDLEGVIHIDGTSRIQIIEKREENPFMFDLLTLLFETQHVYGLINTSFNYQGEPIVHTEKDALNSARRMNLDAIIINYKLYEIKN